MLSLQSTTVTKTMPNDAAVSSTQNISIPDPVKRKFHVWRVTFIDEAKHFYKIGSVWFFILIGILPYGYNLAAQFHVLDTTHIPQQFATIINTLSFIGLMVRLTMLQAKNGGDPSQNMPTLPPVVTAGPVAAPSWKRFFKFKK